MSISELLRNRYYEVMADIPAAAVERLEYLKTFRVDSSFDRHGAIKHVLERGPVRIAKEATVLLVATYHNPYLTLSEKLACMMEDEPETYVMEACIEVATVFDEGSRAAKAKRIWLQEMRAVKQAIKRQEFSRCFDALVAEFFQAMTPDIVESGKDQVLKYHLCVPGAHNRCFYCQFQTTTLLKSLTEQTIRTEVCEPFFGFAKKNGNIQAVNRPPADILRDALQRLVKSRVCGCGSLKKAA